MHHQPEQLLAFCSLLHPSADPSPVPWEERGGNIVFQAGTQTRPEAVCTKARVCAPLGLQSSAEASEVFACPLPTRVDVGVFSLHVWVCVPTVCSCGRAEGHVPAPGGQQPRGWVHRGAVGGKVAAGVALRDENCPGSSSVFMLRLLLVSLTSSLLPPEAHASFFTSTLPSMLWISGGLWLPMRCLPPDTPLLSFLSLLVLQQRGGTGAVLPRWKHAGMRAPPDAFGVGRSQQWGFFCPSEPGSWHIPVPHLCFPPAFPPSWMSAHGRDSHFSLHQCFLDKKKPNGARCGSQGLSPVCPSWSQPAHVHVWLV